MQKNTVYVMQKFLDSVKTNKLNCTDLQISPMASVIIEASQEKKDESKRRTRRHAKRFIG